MTFWERLEALYTQIDWSASPRVNFIVDEWVAQLVTLYRFFICA